MAGLVLNLYLVAPAPFAHPTDLGLSHGNSAISHQKRLLWSLLIADPLLLLLVNIIIKPVAHTGNGFYIAGLG
jgi:hypothetical protein